MRNLCTNILNDSDSLAITSSIVDSGQLVSASFMAYFNDSSAVGTFKIQASNDPTASGGVPGSAPPTHWVDLPSITTNISGGASALLTIPNMVYRWVRAVYTPTGAGVQTISPIDDVGGALNDTYFFLNSALDATQYYVWINVDSGGTDPALPGLTGIEVDISADDDAATIGGLMATAIAAANSSNDFTTSGTTTVTVTNKVNGGFTPASDFDTGFSFTVTHGGSSDIIININALSI